LEAFIQDLGIPPADFVTACSQAAQKVHKRVLGHILAVDDFLLFKKMMVDRNVAMNMEAINAMKKKGDKVDRIERKVVKHAGRARGEPVRDEEADIERVLAESKAIFVSEQADYSGHVNMKCVARRLRRESGKLRMSKSKQSKPATKRRSKH